jgi:hypothetical protein
MDYIVAIALIALIGLAVRSILTFESPPPANTPQSDGKPSSSPKLAPAPVTVEPDVARVIAFERAFPINETDRFDTLRMCQKRLDLTQEEAMDRLIHEPSLFGEMLAYARIEAEDQRRKLNQVVPAGALLKFPTRRCWLFNKPTECWFFTGKFSPQTMRASRMSLKPIREARGHRSSTEHIRGERTAGVCSLGSGP